MDGRRYLSYEADEDWPIGRGQYTAEAAAFQLFDHLGID